MISNTFLSNEIPLNREQYEKAMYIHTQSLVPNACRRVILDRVSNSEIIFRQEGKSGGGVKNNFKTTAFQPKTRFRNHMREYWIPFIRDCIDEISTLGVVAVAYDVIKDSLDNSLVVIPYVVKDGLGVSYSITMLKDHPRVGRTQYRFYRLKDPKSGMACFPTYDPNVRVFSKFGYDPAPNGNLRSIAITCKWQEEWISRMYYYAMKSEQSRPTSIFLESTETNTGIMKTVEHYGDSDVTSKNAESFYKLNRDEIEQIEETRQKVQENVIAKLKDEISSSNMDQPGSIPFDLIGQRMETHLVPIPHGRKIASVSHSSGLHEWQNLNQSYQSYVCAAYGVPRQLIFPEGQRATHDESGLIQTNFMNILENWKKMIEPLLNEVYNDIYAEDDFKGMHSKFLKEESDKFKDEDSDYIAKLRHKYESEQKKLEVDSLGSKTGRAESIELGDGHISARTARPGKNPTLEADVSFHNKAYVQLGHALGLVIPSDLEDPEFEEQAELILEKVHERVANSRMKITFMNIPNVTQDDLLTGFSLGVVDWSEFRQFMRGLHNLPVTGESDENSKDPWAQEFKMSLLRSQKGDILGKLGIVSDIVFPNAKRQAPAADSEGKQSSPKKQKTTNE